ncbi:MAG: thiamine pyrophosphate-binding protein, partial [Rhodobacteraceae bacterium]|nr:thiamine pyrophosphate-binding protein [Paracoccaceae bacterium]
MNVRSGGEVIVELLEAYGINRVFSVPGESFLSVLDALHDSSIQNIVCRHEGGAALMAEAHAKLTGRPGVAIVTRGPGASNAACGVHVASHDSTPMILFVGQVSRDLRGRQAFQEIDIAGVFSP